MNYQIDELDRTLIKALRTHQRATISDVARSTGMARGTVQSRLARLMQSEAITGWGPEVAPPSAGYVVTAFSTLSIVQGAHDVVVQALRVVPEVLEVHVVTGGGDLLCRITARSNDHLHELIQQIVALDGVARTDTQLASNTPIARTVADLIVSTS